MCMGFFVNIKFIFVPRCRYIPVTAWVTRWRGDELLLYIIIFFSLSTTLQRCLLQQHLALFSMWLHPSSYSRSHRSHPAPHSLSPIEMVFKDSDKSSLESNLNSLNSIEYPSDGSGSLSVNSSWGMGAVSVFCLWVVYWWLKYYFRAIPCTLQMQQCWQAQDRANLFLSWQHLIKLECLNTSWNQYKCRTWS